MRNLIAVLAVSLFACGGSASVLSDGGIIPDGGLPVDGGVLLSDGGLVPEQPEVTLTWWELSSSSCGNAATMCSRGLATDAGFRDSLEAEYRAAGCAIGHDSSGIQLYVTCSCSASACGSGQTLLSCPSPANTGAACSWSP